MINRIDYLFALKRRSDCVKLIPGEPVIYLTSNPELAAKFRTKLTPKMEIKNDD